jgi:uncharacterized membrane protein (DUF4010 family)
MIIGPVYSLAIALSLGMLIGLERGWQARERPEGQRVAGIRTYALIGLLGGVCALEPGPWLAATGLGIVGLLVGVFHYLEARNDHDLGLTSLFAALLTFGLGVLAVRGQPLAAAAAATAAVILLASKSSLHAWVRAVSWPELRGFLVLVFMSALVLPLMPSVAIDPWGALVPSEIWFLAIMIAALSLVGHGAVRILGPGRGLAVSALAGGLMSSTAVGLLFARNARQAPEQAQSLAGGALLSSGVMSCRTLLLIGLIRPALLPSLLPGLVGLGLVLFVGGAMVMRLARSDSAAPGASPIVAPQPFDLFVTLRLAGLISLVMLTARLASLALGQGGVLIVSILAGMADVDAVTLSLARAHAPVPDAGMIVLAIGAAIASNTLAKSVLAVVLGGWAHGRTYGLISLLALVVGAAGLAVGFNAL